MRVAWRSLLVCVLGCFVGLVVPGAASAESLCTDTWTGPSEGPWTTAANWSAGKVPTSTDVACIGAGKTVKVTGANHAGVVQGEGALVIFEGSLELANALEASSIKALTVSPGTLSGVGTLNVSSSFLVSGAKISGSGSVVLGPGVSGTISGSLTMTGRTLVNEGTITYSEGFIDLLESAEIKNVGTFNANSEEVSGITTEGEGSPLIVNTGTFQKTKGTGKTAISVAMDNESTITAASGQLIFSGGGTSGQHHAGSWSASAGADIVFMGGTFSLGSVVPLSGTIFVSDINISTAASVTAGQIEGSTASVIINTTYGHGGTLEVNGPAASSVSELTVSAGQLTGAGVLNVSSVFDWTGGRMSGSGSTVLGSGVSGTVQGSAVLAGRTLVNEGTLTFSEGFIDFVESAEIKNVGTFNANSEVTGITKEGEGSPLIVNTGTFQKTKGTGKTKIVVTFENLGVIRELTGKFEFTNLLVADPTTQYGGGENPSAPGHPHATCGKPVSCATGNEFESQADLAIGGRGVGLDLTRYYNSQAAAAGEHGVFGYGWSSSFSDHLAVNKTSKISTLYQADGSTVPFTEGTGGSFTAPAWTQDTLSGTAETGYTLTLANQVKYRFAGASGRLENVTDRNGNATTLSYNEAGRLETITDSAGRKITLAYNSEGLVESAKDPMGHVVKYVYEGGNLKSVTEPGETSARWQFKYDSSHEITEMIDGRGGKTINEYNGSHQVISQKDPMEHVLSFEYEPFHTKITNKATDAVTDEHFTSSDEPVSITHGFGTSSATTQSFTYNAGGYVTSVTDGNGHKTRYEYDSAGNRTKMIDANEHETKWTYDSTHDVETMMTPKGETTTVKRDSHGNAESVSRPAPKEATQTRRYAYDSHGDVESMTDPLGRTWKYEYDTYGDRTAEIDPESDKRTWAYSEDSQVLSTVSPRGNVVGGRPAEFTTKTTRDAQGRPVAVSEQSGQLGYGFQIGTVGSGNGQLKEPTGEVVTAGGNVDVIDRGNNRVEEFSATGEYIGKFGSSGTEKGQFKSPYAIAIDSKGDLWVADEGNNRVQEFNEKHEAILMFGSTGTAGGQFKEPKSIAVAPNGSVYVSDAMNERVEQFNEKGEFLATFGWGVSDGKTEFEICKASCRGGFVGSGNGEFNALRGVTVAANGNVWVADAANNRVQEFNEKNEYVSQFGTKGTNNGQFKEAKGIAIDAAGNVWVADSLNNRVQEFTPSGGFLTTFGNPGAGNGQFAEPFGIAFAASGAAYIADIKNNRVEEWAPIAAVTEYKYDGDGNVEQATDPNGHTTKYTYDADNERVKIEEPNKTITETGYDGAGHVTSQTDGNKHEIRA